MRRDVCSTWSIEYTRRTTLAQNVMNSKRTAIDLFPLLNEDAISAIASGMKPKDIGELAATHRLGKTACEKSVAERAKSIVAACERAKNKTTVFVLPRLHSMRRAPAARRAMCRTRRAARRCT